MTIKEVNEIFKTKYPEGEVFQKGTVGGVADSRVAVVFKRGGKVYAYNVNNYVQLLERFGFELLYEREAKYIENRIKELEELIKAGGEKGLFAFEGDWHTFTVEEIKKMEEEIKECKRRLTLPRVNG